MSNLPLIKILTEKIAEEFSLSPPEFTRGELTNEDVDFLQDECNKPSEFDPLNKRKYLFDKMAAGENRYCIKICKYGQIMVILDNDKQMGDMPWELWGRILRVFYEGIAPNKINTNDNKQFFKIYLLANTNLREFPEGRKPIKPENINGGYTYPCNKQSIVIYRAEDATRVLIHELMHACCVDNYELGVDQVEAETEAWAELIYIALMAQGKKYIFNSLLQRQSEYMIKQNAIVLKHMTSPMSFPWRYTIGKQDVWERWGILIKEFSKPVIQIGNSLRLTYPPNNTLKDRFKVSQSSTIL